MQANRFIDARFDYTEQEKAHDKFRELMDNRFKQNVHKIEEAERKAFMKIVYSCLLAFGIFIAFCVVAWLIIVNADKFTNYILNLY